jgi:hypothetical protein
MVVMARKSSRSMLGRLLGFLTALLFYVAAGVTNALPEWVWEGNWFVVGLLAALSAAVLLGFFLDRASDVGGKPPVP